jgi:hypothetical protein
MGWVRASGDLQMRAWLRNFLLACSVAVAAGFAASPSARAVELIELRWEQLIPESLRHVAAPNLSTKILPHRPMTKRENMSMSSLSDLVTSYNGRRVKISGHVVPFDGDEQPLKRFLLIPFAGGCVKFPPPRNQAILVIREEGIRLTDYYDPVVVTGIINATPTETTIARIGYRISADTIEPQE